MSTQQEATQSTLPDRIARARQEGRTQHALELTRQLFKQDPTEEHRELLRQATLERGKQLQAQGKVSDAATVFSNLLTMGGAPELRAEAARRLAECGAAPQAMAAVSQLEDPAVRQRLLQHAADGAIAKGAAGKNALPPELHAGFDLVLHAFRHYEAGRDEDARAALQGISLQSPFLEWKLLLRGLLAYYANDDARALENWRRLDAERLPYRLCAALRAGIDPAFLKAQPAAIQKSLHAKIAAQSGSALAAPLRDLGNALHQDRLAPAFRKAEALLKKLGGESPQVVPRLAHCFFWAILDHGQPEDLERYLRVFGPPADDPSLNRMQALALEMRGLWPDAHRAWQDFINHVAASPNEWPGAIGAHVQAMIWSRMAENALPQRRRRAQSGNPFFDLFAEQAAPLKPTAEQCYEKAIALAPERLAGHIPLFNLYRRAGKLAKAKKLGQQMLKRFPAHADTLEALGELCLETKDFKKAQEYFEKSMKANPLDLALRGKLARARQKLALKLTLEKKYEPARGQYEQALHLWDGAKTPLLCQWAVAELRAGDVPRADELIASALAQADQRLACRYALVGESVRAQLPPRQKKQFADDLKAALAETPTAAEILVLLESAAAQREVHDDTFHGQKTQEKTILKFLDGIHHNAFDEAQLERLATGLEILDARKPWLKCLNHAKRRHPKNPAFRLLLVDYYLAADYDSQTKLVHEHLDAARRLVEKMPRGELQQRHLDAIKEKEAAIAQRNARRGGPMMDALDRIFSDFADGFDADDEDEGEPWQQAMKRIAVFGGIYSNHLALQAALADAKSRGAEAIYCLGDMGAFGPHPDRVIPLLRDHNVQCIQGNYDHSLGNNLPDCQCGYTDPRDNHFARISYAYTFEHTSPANRAWLGQLPPQLRVQLGPYRVLMCHGSPRRTNEFLWESTTSSAFLEYLLKEHQADVILATHTGIKWHRELSGNRHFINVGVLGRPENDGATNVWYALLSAEPRLRVEFVPVHYDHERLAAEMRAEKLPEEFVQTVLTGWWTTCLEILPAKERRRGLF